KISLNTAALERPAVIREAVERFGSQCIVVAIDARREPARPDEPPRWGVSTHGGRRPAGRDAIDWAREAVALGAGEILLTRMDRAAVEATLSSGVTHFWSRSRGKPWRKGESSGHVQHVQSVYADCDGDTLLVQVHQEGVACHTGQRTCFFTALKGGAGPDPCPAPSTMLERLERTIEDRKRDRPSGSYVAGLLAAGEPEM